MNYDSRFKPPAPAIQVSVVKEPPVPGVYAGALGLVDTGAGKTILPAALVRKLDLKPHCEIAAKSCWKEDPPRLLMTYYVRLRLGNLDVGLLAAASPRETILLGRDFLSRLRLSLDGPRQEFDFIP